MTATAWPPRQYDDAGTDDTAWMAGPTLPCRRNPELFFSEEADDIAEAKRICNTVCKPSRRLSCRSVAGEYGVWGGVARHERVEKECAVCEKTKVLGNFPRREDSPDGYNPTCTVCAVEIGRSRDVHHLPDRAARVALLAAARKRRQAELENRIRTFMRLMNECGRDAATQAMKITPRTAQRWIARFTELEVAA